MTWCAGRAALCKLTHGHGIVATSSAQNIEQLRSPDEVIAMLQLCGLSPAKAQVTFYHM